MDASIYRMRYRDMLTLCVIALLRLGVVMVQSASMRVTGQIRWQWTAADWRRLKLAVIALLTFFVVGRVRLRAGSREARFWRSPALWLADHRRRCSA